MMLHALIVAFSLSSALVVGAEIRSWQTTSDVVTGAVIDLLQELPPLQSHQTAASSAVEFQIDTDETKQGILGYGAGLPQASAYVLNNLKTRNVPLYTSVLHKLFGSSDDGAAINILRFPIGSCDFSMTNTSYDEHQNDYKLEYFAVDEDSKLIVSVLKDILVVNPNMVLIATPWSAPSWLKTWDSLIAYSEKNTLLSTEAAYNTYAKYFANVLKAYQNEGLTIQYFTLQNEPLFGTSDQYPGMYFESSQAIKLGKLVHSLLGDSVKLLAYDHNWDVPSYPLDVLTQSAAGTFTGTAWHCYGGDMASAMDQMHTQFPAYDQHVTECTGAYPGGICDITKGMAGFGWNHEWDMSNILLGAAAHWSSSGVKWILALDENCGPTLPDVTFTSGRPLVSIPCYAASESDIYYNQDYYSIKHMSKYLLAPQSLAQEADKTAVSQNDAYSSGTVRVTTSITADSANASSALILESFYHAGSNLVTVIVLNTNHDNAVDVKITQGATTFADTLPVFSTKIYQWSKQ